MGDISAPGLNSAAIAGAMAAKADQAIRSSGSQAIRSSGSQALGPQALTRENAKIEKSARDFESILLGSWLQQAEQSFAKLPGGDDEEDADAGKDQFQGIAMQSLGSSLTASGGIGLAKMISKQLHKAEDARVAAEAAGKGQPKSLGDPQVSAATKNQGVPARPDRERKEIAVRGKLR